jgi:pimeloyl-ACP methyl ester carboxylesterase
MKTESFNYIKKGSGEIIILVHGWGGSTESLENLQNLLSKKFCVYNLELPGHGDLSKLKKVYDFDMYVTYVKDFISSLDTKVTAYIGHSFGGHIGMRIATDTDKLFKNLVLINSSGLKPNNEEKKRFWKIFANVTKPMKNLPGFKIGRRLFYKFIIRESDYINTSGLLKKTFQKIIESHIKESALIKISNKTLIIWSKKDTYTPLWMGQKLHELIPRSELIKVDNTHGLPLKDPKTTSNIILKWLKK